MKKILLCDDHSLMRLGIIQILKGKFSDAEIKEVSDGESLIEEVIQHEWDLVISDLEMPGRGGLEALVQIKKIKPSLPVLILSVYPENLYAVRVLKAGASGYMDKNAAPYELVIAIQRILLGRKYISAEIAEKLLTSADSDKKPHELLSDREFEIFKLLSSGKTLTQIAKSLGLALTTVSSHRSRIMQKLHLTNNSALTRYAISHSILKDL